MRRPERYREESHVTMEAEIINATISQKMLRTAGGHQLLEERWNRPCLGVLRCQVPSGVSPADTLVLVGA
jgi:hypothetical protein